MLKYSKVKAENGKYLQIVQYIYILGINKSNPLSILRERLVKDDEAGVNGSMYEKLFRGKSSLLTISLHILQVRHILHVTVRMNFWLISITTGKYV